MWKLFLPLLAAMSFIGSAQAANDVNVSTGVTLAGPGLAAHGYDVVAYFTDGKPVIGSDAYAVADAGGTSASPARRTSMRSRPILPNTSPLTAASAPMAWRSARSSTVIPVIGRSSAAGFT